MKFRCTEADSLATIQKSMAGCFHLENKFYYVWSEFFLFKFHFHTVENKEISLKLIKNLNICLKHLNKLFHSTSIGNFPPNIKYITTSIYLDEKSKFPIFSNNFNNRLKTPFESVYRIYFNYFIKLISLLIYFSWIGT